MFIIAANPYLFSRLILSQSLLGRNDTMRPAKKKFFYGLVSILATTAQVTSPEYSSRIIIFQGREMGFKKQKKTKGIQISQTKEETLLALGPLPDTLASSFGDSLRVLKGRGPLLQPDHSRNKIRGIPYVEL